MPAVGSMLAVQYLPPVGVKHLVVKILVHLCRLARMDGFAL